MKIESIHIENFRSFENDTITIDDYTNFVGPNGGGKSTVLCALNIFFREIENSATDAISLSVEDFHKKDTSRPIKITITFGSLSTEAQEDFKNYYRQDKLVVSAVAEFNSITGRADVKQYGQRLGMEAFKEFFKAEGNTEPVKTLKAIYIDLVKQFTELPAPGTKDAMVEALRVYESEHPELSALIESEDQFYGVSKGADRMNKYIQWVYVPAVKDVTKEQNENKSSALGKLLARTVRLKVNFDEAVGKLQEKTQTEYTGMLESNQSALDGLGKILTEKLGVWAHPSASVRLEWQKDSKKSIQIEQPSAKTIVGEGGFEGDLSRLGHGFQRSYLLALLQVLSTAAEDKNVPRLILGCEEPELYQHPPQARHLASVLEQLSAKDAQVLVTTHSPLFIAGEGFENTRMVRYEHRMTSSKSKSLTFKDVADRIATVTGKTPTKPAGIEARLHQELQSGINELFFARNLILVEGLEDVALVTSWMMLTSRWDEFRQKGIHIVPVNGKGHLLWPLVIAQGFGIPTFVLFDADGNTIEASARGKHEKENKELLGLLGGDPTVPFPTTTIWADRYVVWPENITKIIENEIPAAKLSAYNTTADAEHGHASALQKNGLHIATKLRLAFEDGTSIPSLDRLCSSILTAAQI